MTSPATARHLPTSAFAIMRAGVGIASLLAPIESARFFGVDTIHGSRIIFRLFGARELVLGGMLWRAQTAATSANASEKDSARQTMRTLLYFGLLIDAIDVVSSTVCIGEGSMGGRAIWLVGVGAAAFAGLGVVGLKAIE